MVYEVPARYRKGPLSQRSAIANFIADFLQGLGLGLGLGLVSVIVTGSYSLYPVQSTLDLCDSGPESFMNVKSSGLVKLLLIRTWSTLIDSISFKLGSEVCLLICCSISLVVVLRMVCLFVVEIILKCHLKEKTGYLDKLTESKNCN